jgi:ABC-type transport system involved in cytochrome c biogenesis permease subunit
MFNLEESIAGWRRQMLAAGIKSPAPLEELENHLRQDIAALVLAGKPELESFQIAAARLGSPASVRIEFDKIKGGHIPSVKVGSMLWLATVIGMTVFLARRLFAGRVNPLLFAHILAITAGYGAAFLTGLFGICFVCWSRFKRLSPVRQQSLGRAVHLFSRVAVGFVIVGTMVGLPVSKQLFGRFWSWDPKEIGALCAVVWFAAMVAMPRFRRLSDRGLMLLCIGGNMVVSLAWFGAGMMDYNLKMHGRATANYWPLAAFLGLQFCFLVAGLTSSHDKTERLDATGG